MNNPPEAAGNRHKPARGKNPLAKDGKVRENLFSRHIFPGLVPICTARLSRRALLFLGYDLQARRLTPHGNDHRRHAPRDGNATRVRPLVRTIS
jgi:hypothetical protein